MHALACADKDIKRRFSFEALAEGRRNKIATINPSADDFNMDGPKTATSMTRNPAKPIKYGINAIPVRVMSIKAESNAPTAMIIGATFAVANIGTPSIPKVGTRAAI